MTFKRESLEDIIDAHNNLQLMKFNLPLSDVNFTTFLRFDEFSKFNINNLTVNSDLKSYHIA